MSARKPLSRLSADSPEAGVSKPYVEPALAGDNKAFDLVESCLPRMTLKVSMCRSVLKRSSKAYL